MKAHVKVNLLVQLEDPDAPSLSSFGSGDATDGLVVKEGARRVALAYPITMQVAGERDVIDKPDALSLAQTIHTSIQKQLAMLSCRLVEPALLIEKPPPSEPEPESAPAPVDASAPQTLAELIEKEKCPHCGMCGQKLVDGDTLCNHCNRVIKLKPQPMA